MSILTRSEASRVFLRPQLIDQLLEHRGISLEDLAADWEDTYGEDTAPSRETLYRWIREGFYPPTKPPKGKKGAAKDAPLSKLLQFCALMNADPLALFDYEQNGFFSRFARLRKAVHAGLGKLGAYQPLFEMYFPDERWPSDSLAQRYWKRRWFAQEFDNRGHVDEGEDALITVQFAEPTHALPRAVHIAYRRIATKESDPLWRFYGTVIAFGRSVELYSEGGHHARMARVDEDQLCFRTHFGHRLSEFRIASLHDFTYDVSHPCNDKSIIGFEW